MPLLVRRVPMDQDIPKAVEEGAAKATSFIQGVFSERDNTPSSSRILMWVFGIFSMVIIGVMVHHMLYIKDSITLTAWLSAFPMIIVSLIGLVVAPYTVNQGASSMNNMMASIAAVRAKKE
jgi:hypothetical protein